MNRQQKAARTKAERAAARVWEDVSKKMELVGCKCSLHEGMTHDDLAKLKGGCTDTPERGFAGTELGGRYTCPALALYRRAVPAPVLEEEAA